MSDENDPRPALPPGWAWATIGDIAEYVNRGRAPVYASEGGYPVINQRCIRWSGIDFSYLKLTTEAAFQRLDEAQHLRAGDVLWNSTGTGTIGRAAVFDAENKYPDITVDTHVTVIRPTGYEPMLLRHWIFSDAVQKKMHKLQSGSTNQVELSRRAVIESPIPVPPRNEQRRILAHIEEFFGEIEAGEQELEKAREGLETYRRTVLKAAVTGELTKEWREKNAPNETGADLVAHILKERRTAWEKAELAKMNAKGQTPRSDAWKARYQEPEGLNATGLASLPQGWVWTSVGQIFRVYVGATPSRSQLSYWGGDIPWVSSGEVAFCRISETRERITELGLSKSSTRLHPRGTVLLAMIGEGKTRGQAAILDVAACNSQNSAAICVSETPVPPEFIYYVLMYMYEQNRRMSSGGNQKALNSDKVKSIRIPLPPLAEITEIIARLEEQIEAIDDLTSGLATLEIEAKQLRQAILSAAFSGKLVRQDPNDEPASIQLRRLRAALTTVPAQRRRTNQTAKTLKRLRGRPRRSAVEETPL